MCRWPQNNIALPCGERKGDSAPKVEKEKGKRINRDDLQQFMHQDIVVTFF